MAQTEPESEPQEGATRSRRWLIPVAVVLAAAALFLGARHPAVKGGIVAVLDFCKGLGPWAAVVIIAAYVVACLLMFPGSILTVGAGFIFSATTGSVLWGVIMGAIVVDVGATLGASAAFLVGRKFARGWVEKRVTGHPKFAAIDKAVGKQGFKIVFLTRLTPVFPFVLQNYAYGLTDVALWKYALASFIAMLPGTVVFVYFGAIAESLTAAAAGETTGGVAQKVFVVVGLLVAVAVTVLVTRIARRALEGAAEEAGAEELVEEQDQ